MMSPGLSFEILDVEGTLNGTFTGLSEGNLVGTYDDTNLYITYAGGDGNDVTLFSALPGDFNFDGNFDGFDFLEWQQGFGGSYDSADYADWEANFGVVAPAVAATTVPEPSVLVLLGVGGLGCSLREPGKLV